MQMAGVAAAGELNDRQRFRGFFRTDVASEFVGPALAEMARQFNWRQMAIVSQDESLFIKVCVSYKWLNPAEHFIALDCGEFGFFIRA